MFTHAIKQSFDLQKTGCIQNGGRQNYAARWRLLVKHFLSDEHFSCFGTLKYLKFKIFVNCFKKIFIQNFFYSKEALFEFFAIKFFRISLY